MIFDYLDEFYIANTLSIRQIRESIRASDTKAFVAGIYAGTKYEDDADLFPWLELKECLERALKLKQASKTVPAPTAGRVDPATVKQNNDIVSVIERYTKLRKSGKRFSAKCPIHNDKNPSLVVYPEKQTWDCFGCGKGGVVISFIEAIENTDFRGAISILGGG
jgi:hypothetical protein